jgi:hypothetical protein
MKRKKSYMLRIVIAVVDEIRRDNTPRHEKSSRDDLLSLRHLPEEKQVPARFTGPEGPTLLVPFGKAFTPDYMLEDSILSDDDLHARSLLLSDIARINLWILEFK